MKPLFGHWMDDALCYLWIKVTKITQLQTEIHKRICPECTFVAKIDVGAQLMWKHNTVGQPKTSNNHKNSAPFAWITGTLDSNKHQDSHYFLCLWCGESLIVISETYSVFQDSKLWIRLTLFNCEFSLELQGGSGVLLILLKQVFFLTYL